MRCFVALWPDDAVRERLEAAAREWHRRFPAARRMRGANLHLTLAFIGELDEARARQIARALAQAAWRTGTWRVDRIGTFERARVLWAGSDDNPLLAAIAGPVRALLDELQVRYDRKPFAPHVTLLRNLPRSAAGASAPIEPPLEWIVAPPLLLHSVHEADGTRYVALDAAPISAAPVRERGR